MSVTSANKVAASILISCVLSLLTLAGGLLFMAQAQNQQSMVSEKKLIESGMAAQGDTLSRLNREYALWKEFYDAMAKNDLEWIYPNVATIVTETQNVDMTILFDADTKPVYAWDLTTGETSDLGIVDDGLAEAVKAYVASSPALDGKDQVQYMTLKGKPALVSYARISVVDAKDLLPGEPKFGIAFAYYLTDARIKNIGEQFFIKNLALGPDNSADSVVLADASGKSISVLNWTPDKLGTETLYRILLPLCLIAFLPFAASVFLTLRARNQTYAALENERLARLEAAASHDAALQSSKMAQLGNLTATVAHEIRNPLGSVRTSAFLLSRKLGDSRPDLVPLINRIDNGISRCDVTISQLLDYARSRDMTKSNIALDDWIVKIATEQSEKLPPGLTVECDLALGNTLVPIDAERFERVLINLISNASEAIATRKDAAKTDDRIIIATRLHNGEAEISVADTGPGIAAEDMAKIVNPMYTTKSFGTGLGLSAVFNIVEKHGGKLTFANRPEGGAVFVITLPMDAAEPLKEAA